MKNYVSLMSRDFDKEMIRLSKNMTQLLRHGAVKAGINMDERGFVKVDDLLKLPRFNRYSLDEIIEVVETNTKQRFTLENREKNSGAGAIEAGNWYVRANQGHSGEVMELLDFTKMLRKITDPSELPVCMHGTYRKCVPSIMKQGLSRMSRHAVHMATSRDAKSGMRRSCNTIIYIDVPKAMEEGLEFYESDNGVILCPGNADGIIPHKFLRYEFL